MDGVGKLALIFALTTAMAFALLFASPRTKADFHEVQIKQLLAGAFGNDAVEFVELRMLTERQNCLAGGEILGASFGCQAPTPTDGARLVFFDASGNQTGEFEFPGNAPLGGAGRSILVATLEFDQVFTVQPDFIMPSNVIGDSGKVCYKDVPGASFEVNQCLAYGNFTGDTEGFGNPAAALPITGSSSLIRAAATSNNAIDFRLATASPKNNNDEIGGVAFTVQPTHTRLVTPIIPAVRVEVLDALGNTATSATDIVTIAISSNPNGGTLSGVTTVSAVNGVAIFSDLRLDKAGIGYTLAASAPNRSGTTSAPFDIVTCQLGDTNSDGSINALDITMIKLVVLGALAETPCADADGNNKVNALDITATKILVLTAP